MILEKRQIIESEGVIVDIFNIDNGISGVINWIPQLTTKALIGKANKSSNTTLSLEVYRKGIFLPDVNIKNGTLVKNTISNEYYIVVASSDEIIDNQIASVNTLMLKCNAVIDVVGKKETADDVGNIYVDDVIKVSDLNIYMYSDRVDLTQYKPGLYPDNQYTLYIPAVPISLTDKVILKTANPPASLKITGIDSLSYENLLVISVSSSVN